MKLLFAIKAMNNPGGGAERVLADIANGLSRRGHDVSVLTFERPGGRSFYPLDPTITRLELGIGSTTARAGVFETFRRIGALRRAVPANDPDIAVGFMHSMFLPLGLALIGTRYPVIGSEHTAPEHYRTRHTERMLLWLAPLLLRRLVSVSEQVRALYPTRLRSAMDVIPNPISVSPTSVADVANSREGANTLLSVGRLTAEKDFPLLVEAFASIAPELPTWRLRIVGDGEERERLRDLSATLGVEDRVELPGSTAAIGHEYAGAQLYVVPSRYESFGLATAEAIGHGLPAVGFADCPGTNQLIVDGVNGLLVAGAERTQALAAALRHLMSNERERQRLANGESIRNAFGMDTVLDAWEELLGRLR